MWTLCLLSLLTQPDDAATVSDAAPPTASIVGFVQPAGRGVVFVLDGKTGAPLLADTRQPMRSFFDEFRSRSLENATDAEKQAAAARQKRRAELMKDSFFDLFLNAAINPAGHFSIDSLPPGDYRLVGQVWAGTEGMLPSGYDSRVPPSSIITLLGTADVSITAGQRTTLHLMPAGVSTLRIATDPESTDGLLLISLGLLDGHPLGGPAAYGPDFFKGLIGATLRGQRERVVTIQGLPYDRPIELLMFNNDNNGGPGYIRTTVKDAVESQIDPRLRAERVAEVTMPVFAPWSDGRDDPPADLLPLVETMEAIPREDRRDRFHEWIGFELQKPYPSDPPFNTSGKRDLDAYRTAYQTYEDARTAALSRDITVTINDRSYRMVDLLAAQSFVRLRESHAARRARNNRTTDSERINAPETAPEETP